MHVHRRTHLKHIRLPHGVAVHPGDTQTHIWDGTHVRITSNDAIPLGIIILHESRLHHRVEVPNTVHWIIFFEIKEIFEVNGLIHVHNCL